MLPTMILVNRKDHAVKDLKTKDFTKWQVKCIKEVFFLNKLVLTFSFH